MSGAAAVGASFRLVECCHDPFLFLDDLGVGEGVLVFRGEVVNPVDGEEDFPSLTHAGNVDGLDFHLSCFPIWNQTKSLEGSSRMIETLY
jgi:hypothetical protein